MRAALLARVLAGLLIVWAGAVATAPAAAQASVAAAAAPVIPVAMTIAPAFTALDERARCGGQPETLYLSVHNQGAESLAVESVALLAPADLELCGPPVAVSIEGGQRAVVPLRIGLRDTPRQGTMPLILDVGVATRVGGVERRDHLLASDRIEVRIPGLSDALQVLGVPTLLLLPGLLAVSALFLLFRPTWRDDFTPGKPAFWMLAIPASALLYWGFTLTTGRGGEFAERLGLWDVAILWIASIVTGLVLGGLLRAAKNYRDAERAKKTAGESAARSPTVNDTPLQLFERLQLLGGFEQTPQWSAFGAHQGFLIEPNGTEMRWLVPQATVKTTRPTGTDKAAWDRAVRDLRQMFDDKAPLSKLFPFLQASAAAGLELKWKERAKPQKLKKDDDVPPAGGNPYYVERP